MAVTSAALMRFSARRVLCSASAVVCRPVTGSHVLRVDGFSELSRVICKGEKVSSSVFDVGGHSWRLDMYPNGTKSSILERHIGVFLRLDSNTTGERVWAGPKFGVLDQHDNPGDVRDAGPPFGFNNPGATFGFPDFIDKGSLFLERPMRTS